jgi:uncharacterized metal-binding protein
MLVVSLSRGRISTQDRVPLDITSPLSIIPILRKRRIDTVVCGGISRQTRDALSMAGIAVIDNVACSVDELLGALASGHLCTGYGFRAEPVPTSSPEPLGGKPADGRGMNCLTCRDRVCLRGEPCAAAPPTPSAWLTSDVHRMLEATTDISSEEERKLCRLAEVVYFCIEMQYHRIGIAFCEDLREPAEILCGVLERSFETVPVCCKVGGPPTADDSVLPPVTCNPVAQAEALNRAGTDINVIVGLCMGADCIFAQRSVAPVTTLFVKDRSLANNPIGAVYSEYYLRESVPTAEPWSASSTLPEHNSVREEPS